MSQAMIYLDRVGRFLWNRVWSGSLGEVSIWMDVHTHKGEFEIITMLGLCSLDVERAVAEEQMDGLYFCFIT